MSMVAGDIVQAEDEEEEHLDDTEDDEESDGPRQLNNELDARVAEVRIALAADGYVRAAVRAL